MNETLKEWVKLEKQEKALKAKRDKLSEQIAAMYKTEQGSQTFHEDDFTIEIKNNKKVDVNQELAEKLFAEYEPDTLPFRVKYELDATKYGAIKKVSPKFYRICSDAVTFTPAKVGVKVSLKKGGK